MRRYSIFLVISIILSFSLVRPIEAEDITKVKIRSVLGNIKNSVLLYDNIIEPSNFSLFKYQKKKNTYFILELSQNKYIEWIKIYFTDNSNPEAVKIEFSQNLFTWETVAVTKKFQRYKSSIKLANIFCYNRAAKFVRVNFKNSQNKAIKISEIQIEINNKLKVSSAKLEALEIGKYKVKLKVTSDIATSLFIKYGEALDSLIDGPSTLEYRKQNIINITGLLRGTEYYFVGIVKDCNDNIKYTEPIKFKTRGIPLPRIKNVKIKEIGSKFISINFDSNVETKYNIFFGYSYDKLHKAAYRKFSQKHSVILKNLKPETLIYYQIEIIDKSGNREISEIYNARTLPENIAIGSKISGDFNYIGESIAPQLDKNAGKRLVDGDYSYRNGSVMSGNIFSKNQQLILDLRRITAVQRIDFIWWGLMYSTAFDIEISKDNKKWQKIQENVNVNKNIRYNFKINTPYIVSRVYVKDRIRYIRVIFKRGKCKRRFPQYVNLRLLEVLVIPEKDYPETITPVFKR